MKGSCEKLVNVLIKNVGSVVSEKALGEVCKFIPFEGMGRLPLEKFVEDEEAIALIREFELDNPENMVKFMIDMLAAAFEGCIDGIIGLKEMHIEETMSKVRSAKNMYYLAIDNPDNMKEQQLRDAQNLLIQTVGDLESQIVSCINEIKGFENLPKYKFVLKSLIIVKEAQIDIKLLKGMIEAMEDAVMLQVVIAKQNGDNITRSVLEPYRDFYEEKLLDKGVPRMLNEYDEEKKQGFFLQLSERLKRIGEFGKIYETFEQEYEDLDAYEDIVFE